MGQGTPQDVKPAVGLARSILAVALGVLIPALVTIIALLIRRSYDFPYSFLYMVALLFVAYLGGLLAGLTGAVVSTLFLDYFLVGPPGLTLLELQAEVIPSLVFLISGVVVAGAGDQYRRYQARLQRDLIATQREARSEALIVAVADHLASERERSWTLQVICQRVEEFLGEPCALAISEDSDKLRLFWPSGAAPGNHAVRDELAAPLAIQEDPLLQAIAGASRPLILTPRAQGLPMSNSRAAAEWFDRLALAAVLAAPLRFGAEYLGALVAFTKRPLGWDNDVIQTIEAVADRVAAAIHRDRLEIQRRRRERAARLVDSLMVQFARELDLPAMLDAITRRATESLGDWAAIALIEPQSPELRLAALYHPEAEKVRRLKAASDRYPIRRENPLVARIFEAQGAIAIFADDALVQQLLPQTPLLQEIFTQLDVHGGLAVPIRVGGETLGFFAVGSDSPRTWDQEDLRLASVIADRAGVAIKNARLHEAEHNARLSAEREARRVQAISRVIAIAASKPDLADVFDEFSESLQLLLPYMWVTVSLQGPTPDVLVTPYMKGPAPGVSALERPAAGTAPGWVLETQRPLVRRDTDATDEFEEDRRTGATGIRSYIIVPLTVGGRTIGTLNLGHHVPGFYTEEHARIVQYIADQLAITISRFQLFDELQRRAGELSETLQRALLPTELPKAPLMSVAALYRPADPEANIGGDWYDAALLPDDRVLLSVGDVAGHGVTAAAISGQVRNVIRAFALEEQRPHEILMAADRFLAMLPDSLQLSVWIGLFDPFTGDLAYSGAGHPPPYLVARGRAETLDSTGPLLGISTTTAYEETRIRLEPGARLIAYTDGLIEASRDVLDGERRLKEAALATAGQQPGPATEALLARVLNGGSPQDDIALLIVDSLPQDAPLHFSLRAAPANLRKVRRAVRAYAERMGIPPERVEEVVMAVGEAALNVVEHAYEGRPGALTVQGERRGDRLMISVRDLGRWRAPVDRGRGRGTRIMKGFTESTTTHTGPQGTVVEMTWVLDQRVSAAR